ncbi:MAG: glutaredoxin domain-containing protein [Pseudomonadota bacterium]
MEVTDRIRQLLTTHPVVLFMRGSPARPMCPDSAAASEVLEHCGSTFVTVDVQTDPELRAYLPKFADAPGFPQLFLQGELIGGASILLDLDHQGELAPMLASCELPRASNQ